MSASLTQHDPECRISSKYLHTFLMTAVSLHRNAHSRIRTLCSEAQYGHVARGGTGGYPEVFLELEAMGSLVSQTDPKSAILCGTTCRSIAKGYLLVLCRRRNGRRRSMRDWPGTVCGIKSPRSCLGGTGTLGELHFDSLFRGLFEQ